MKHILERKEQIYFFDLSSFSNYGNKHKERLSAQPSHTRVQSKLGTIYCNTWLYFYCYLTNLAWLHSVQIYPSSKYSKHTFSCSGNMPFESPSVLKSLRSSCMKKRIHYWACFTERVKYSCRFPKKFLMPATQTDMTA